MLCVELIVLCLVDATVFGIHLGLFGVRVVVDYWTHAACLELV